LKVFIKSKVSAPLTFPYDNACIEAFHAVLRKELVCRIRPRPCEEMKTLLFEYIKSWYN